MKSIDIKRFFLSMTEFYMRWLIIILVLVSIGSVSMAGDSIVFYCDYDTKYCHGKGTQA